jgi:hypothetical protein
MKIAAKLPNVSESIVEPEVENKLHYIANITHLQDQTPSKEKCGAKNVNLSQMAARLRSVINDIHD